MSKRNVETVRRWVDAYNRRDFECLIGLNDPDFEFRSIFVSIESVFRGTEAFPYAYFKTLDEAYDQFLLVPSEFVVFREETFTDRAEAFDAVGLLEQDAQAESS